MAETFGVLLGVGQVVGSVFSLIKTAQSFIDAPETLRSCERSFLELHNIVQPILDDPSSHPENAKQQATAIIECIEASGIQKLLQKSHLRQRLCFIRKGRHLPRLRDEIEGKRQNLLLINSLHRKTPRSYPRTATCDPFDPEGFLSDHDLPRPATVATFNMPKSPSKNTSKSPTEDMSWEEIIEAVECIGKSKELSESSVWYKNNAHNSDQYNGCGDRDGYWVKNKQRGTGNQVNGSTQDPCAAVQTELHPQARQSFLTYPHTPPDTPMGGYGPNLY